MKQEGRELRESGKTESDRNYPKKVGECVRVLVRDREVGVSFVVGNAIIGGGTD
jgi:hypothetical protein